MDELLNIARTGMEKLSKEAPELFSRMVDTLDAYNLKKAGTLETIQELDCAIRDYMYDHRR